MDSRFRGSDNGLEFFRILLMTILEMNGRDTMTLPLILQRQLWCLWRPERADFPYLSNGSNEFPFSCSGPDGSTATHTYTFTTIPGGVTRTVTLSATVHTITDVGTGMGSATPAPPSATPAPPSASASP